MYKLTDLIHFLPDFFFFIVAFNCAFEGQNTSHRIFLYFVIQLSIINPTEFIYIYIILSHTHLIQYITFNLPYFWLNPWCVQETLQRYHNLKHFVQHQPELVQPKEKNINKN